MMMQDFLAIARFALSLCERVISQEKQNNA